MRFLVLACSTNWMMFCGGFQSAPRLHHHSVGTMRRYPKQVVSPLQSTYASSPVTGHEAVDRNDVEEEELYAKLDILQGVVKELHGYRVADQERIKELQSKHQDALTTLRTKYQEITTRDAERIQELQYLVSQQKLQTLSAQEEKERALAEADDALKEMEVLKKQLMKRERELKRANDEIDSGDEEIKELQKRFQEQENLENETIDILKKEHRREVDKLNEELNRARKDSEKQRQQISDLKAEAEEIREEHSDRVEIAMGAAEAARKDARNLQKDLSQSERRRKRLQVQMRLQQLVLQGMLAELEKQQDT